MILFSKLECVQYYQGFAIIPGRNLIPDEVGRRIVADPAFIEAQDQGSPVTYGKLIIEVAPLSLPSESKPVANGAAGTETPTAKGKAAAKGKAVVETGVSGLPEAEAIKAVKIATVVDQIQLIATNDVRETVKLAAVNRLDELANQARSEQAKGGAGA